MPQALPVVASWAAAAWSSAVTATAVGLTKIGVMAAIGEGATIALAGAAVKTGAMIGLSVAAAALMRPNTPSSGTTLDFKPDPKAPIRGAMGYTALGGNKVFQATWGYKKVAMSLGVALSLGPIDQVPRFEADGATVTFTGQQNEATGFYAADMWQRTTLGLPGDAALLPPTGLKYGNPGLTGWGAQHAAPQTAFSFWTMVLAKNPEDRDVYTNGEPDPRWIGRWMKLWDPRKDSTYPGGSGPQRRNDWRTWGWSENPYVHALAWVRGHYKLNLDGTADRSKRIAGVGAPDAAVDIPAFVEGMNVADANAWTISGEWSTADGKFQTLLAMLQAGGGEPISRGAQISVMVNAPRVATYTYTRDDLIGQAEIRPLTPRRERKNTIVPRYKSEANGWQYVPAGEVTSDVYRDEDRGEPRSLEIEYTHVRSAKQAGQLAAYDLANQREGLTATLPSKVHLMHVHPGACIKVDVPELALAGQKFIVRRATTNHQSASVTLELRSESDGKHPWALGQAAQPAPSPSLSAVDPKYVPSPAPSDWTAVPKPPGEGGVSQPIVIIELPIETTDIAAVIIKHGPTASGPWTDGYEGSPRTDGRYEVSGLTPGQTYCFSLQYIAKNGAISEPDIKCGIVAGDLIAGDTMNVGGTPVSDLLADLRSAEQLAQQAKQAIQDLEDTYGDTASAAVSAAAAAVSAADAAAEAALASGKAEDAQASAVAASASAGSANTSAQASSAPASSASAKATDAEQSAQAATAAKAAAETARGQAQAASTSAASSRDDAAGSAANASSSATLAAGSRDAAAGSASAAAGSASTASTKASEAGTFADAAMASQVSASTAAVQAQEALATMGRTNIVARENAHPASPIVDIASPSASGWGFRLVGSGNAIERSVVVGPLKQSTQYSLGFKARRSDGATSQASLSVDLYPDTLPERVFQIGPDWTDFSWEGITSSHIDMTLPNARLRFFRSQLTSGITFEVTDIKLEEGATATSWSPSPKDAAFSARAAATSAATASASETSAGQSASAAAGSATTANTKAGEAGTFASQASSSASSAAGSAVTASNASGTAVTARDAAIGARNDAQASAATAVTQASSASASAASAQISASLAASAALDSGANLLPNSTFSNGLSSWNSSSWAASSLVAFYGAHAFGSSNGTTVLTSYPIPIAPNGTYTLSADAKRQADSGNLVLDFQWLNSSGAHLSYSGRVIYNENHDFGFNTRRSVTAIAPSGAAFTVIRVYGENITGVRPNGLGVRQIKVEAGSKATLWRDDMQLGTVSAQLNITAAVAADAKDRVGSARFSVSGGAGGDPFDISLKAGPNGSDASLTATRVRLRNIVNGQAINVLDVVGGKARFGGDVEIDGNLLLSGTINGRRVIIPDTVTPMAATYAAGSVGLNGTTATQVQEVWVTTQGGPVVVEFNGLIHMRHDPAGSFDAVMEVRRSPNTGTGIQMLYMSVPALGGGNDSVLGMYPLKLIDRPAAGTWRYFVTVWSTTNNMTVQEVRQRFMSALEYRTNS